MSYVETPSLGHRAGQVLLSSRPISWINTAFPFASAYVLTTGRVDALLVVGTLFFLIPYNLLMYGINDVFDYESDLRNPRKGGEEGAVLDPSLHRTVVWAGAESAFLSSERTVSVGTAPLAIQAAALSRSTLRVTGWVVGL